MQNTTVKISKAVEKAGFVVISTILLRTTAKHKFVFELLVNICFLWRNRANSVSLAWFLQSQSNFVWQTTFAHNAVQIGLLSKLLVIKFVGKLLGLRVSA